MATYGLTETGFLAKRFETIKSDISLDIYNNFGIDINSDPDNMFKNLVNILILPSAQNWASVEALQSMMDIDQSSDIYLDYLAGSKLIYRQEGVKPSGDVFVTINYEDTLTLPVGSSFYNRNNEEFTTTLKDTLSTESLTQFTAVFKIGTSGDITLIIDGVTFTRNTVEDGGQQEAIELLKQDILAEGYYIESDLLNGYLYWFVRSEENTMDTTPSFTLTLGNSFDLEKSTITKAFNVEYSLEGDFSFLANSFTTAPPFTAIESFRNNTIKNGRYRETDEELRERFRLSPSLLGKSTASAIRSAVLGIEGVSDASVGQNKTMFTNDEGVPAKSIELVVKGGNDEEIAQALYDTAGAGIELYGRTSTEIEDENGDPLIIKYSRVQDKYIWTRITYTLYDEEDFPINGAQQIETSVVSTINGLDIGKDVIQGRVASSIYRNVTGIEDITVELFGSTDLNDTPIYTSTTPVRISSSEEALQLAENIIIRRG